MELEKEKKKDPTDQRVLAQDITPEQIPKKLFKQGGRIAIIDHEGGIFNTLAGRYNNGMPNLDVITKGYDGSSYQVDRGDRSISLSKIYVTLLIFLQPRVFKETKNFSHFIDTGFFARTLFAIPKSLVTEKEHNQPPIKREIKQDYDSLIKELLDANSEKTFLEFSEDAKEMYIKFCTSIARARGTGGEFEDEIIGAWVEKLKGNVARITGILHIAETPDYKENNTISVATLSKGIELSKFLIEHAKAIFDYTGRDEKNHNAMDLWNYIKEKRLETCTEIEIFRNRRNSVKFQDKNNITSALKILEERHLIFEVEVVKNGSGRPPSPKYRINNRIIAKWKK